MACGDTAQLSEWRVEILHIYLNGVSAVNYAGKRRKTRKGFCAGETEVERPLGGPERR